MRIVRYEHGGRVGVGVRQDDRIAPTRYTDVRDLMRDMRDGAATLPAEADALPLGDCRLLAPIPAPGKLLFSGLNYRSHTEENPGAVLPTYPHCFAKLPSSVIGPDEAIVLPAADMRVDYEVELAVVIGAVTRGVTPEDALAHVFGYTVANDVSARDVQFRDNQMRDEIPDPGTLRVASYVNGERRQDSATSDMLFDVPTLIAFFSRYITFYPGDVIATGTPAGVGTFRKPPTYLRPGDTVTVEVDAIGRLTNPVVAGWRDR